MESINYFENGIKELTTENLYSVNGGGFAYDFGFFIRELVISAVNGGGAVGYSYAAIDISLYYRPL